MRQTEKDPIICLSSYYAKTDMYDRNFLV